MQGHAQCPAFAPGSSEVAVGFLVFLYLLVHNLPPLCMHAAIFSPLWFLCILLLEEMFVPVQALQQRGPGPRSQPVSKPGIGSIEENQARPKGGRPWRLAPWKRPQMPLPRPLACESLSCRTRGAAPGSRSLVTAAQTSEDIPPGPGEKDLTVRDPTCRASPQHPRWALTMCPFSAPNPQSVPQDSAPAGNRRL